MFFLCIYLITYKIFQFVLIVFFWRVEFACGAPPVASAGIRTREMCRRIFFFFPLFSSAAHLFMNLGMCGFEVKPGDAVEKEANGDKTPPVGPSERTAARCGITIIITPIRTPRGGERCLLVYCHMLWSCHVGDVSESHMSHVPLFLVQRGPTHSWSI